MGKKAVSSLGARLANSLPSRPVSSLPPWDSVFSQHLQGLQAHQSQHLLTSAFPLPMVFTRAKQHQASPNRGEACPFALPSCPLQNCVDNGPVPETSSLNLGRLSDKHRPCRETIAVLTGWREAGLSTCSKESSQTGSSSHTIAACFPCFTREGVHIPDKGTIYFPTEGDTWHPKVKPRPGPCLLD